jgi:hypothetical protein
MTQIQDRFELTLLAVMSTAVLFIGAASSELHGTAVLDASLAPEIADSSNPLAPYIADEPYLRFHTATAGRPRTQREAYQPVPRWRGINEKI